MACGRVGVQAKHMPEPAQAVASKKALCVRLRRSFVTVPWRAVPQAGVIRIVTPLGAACRRNLWLRVLTLM